MKILSLALMIIISSCSSYRGVNRIGESTLSVNGGLIKDSEWRDSLVFERRSFYQQANMLYDVLIAKVDKNSPFNKWFGSMPSSCSQVSILLFYVKPGSLLHRNSIREQIESSGYNIISIPTFSKHIQSNSSFNTKNLGFYKVRAICPKTGNSGSAISFALPGYKNTTIEL